MTEQSCVSTMLIVLHGYLSPCIFEVYSHFPDLVEHSESEARIVDGDLCLINGPSNPLCPVLDAFAPDLTCFSRRPYTFQVGLIWSESHSCVVVQANLVVDPWKFWREVWYGWRVRYRGHTSRG